MDGPHANRAKSTSLLGESQQVFEVSQWSTYDEKFYVLEFRALYMGELRKNMTSTGTITKKNLVTLAKVRLLVQKNFFYEVIFFLFLD